MALRKFGCVRLQNFGLTILDFFLPRFCLFCGAAVNSEPGAVICPDCRSQVQWIHSPMCPVCGAPFKGVGFDHLCGNCQLHPPPYHRARAVAFYEGVVLEAIHRFKYHRRQVYARVLKEWLATPAGLEMAQAADLILPVPLHPRRVRSRGFNQALILAQAFSAVPLGRDLLIRSRWTTPQVGLSGKERLENVRRAFAVTNPEAVAGKNILLIDDVFTTGATVSECAKVLRKAGARQVEVLTVARVGYA
ncbi:MAG: ComF family protein [Deltaproteobacteria bacterium]|nr:ComF family protein [Deltaproteobacteria bacterium]MBW2135610.1 ComF family protein [Deltaproteobacteria bacterium]